MYSCRSPCASNPPAPIRAEIPRWHGFPGLPTVRARSRDSIWRPHDPQGPPFRAPRPRRSSWHRADGPQRTITSYSDCPRQSFEPFLGLFKGCLLPRSQQSDRYHAHLLPRPCLPQDACGMPAWRTPPTRSSPRLTRQAPRARNPDFESCRQLDRRSNLTVGRPPSLPSQPSRATHRQVAASVSGSIDL